MGDEPVPGPYDDLVKMFEEWKATLPEVKLKRNYWQPLFISSRSEISIDQRGEVK